MKDRNNKEEGLSIHLPVMVKEVLRYLAPGESKDGVFLDATTSTGGHAVEIARQLGSEGTLIGLDLDTKALEFTKERLSGTPPEVLLYQANYKDMDLALERAGKSKADGILFDLGFSTFQIEESSRGFSFQRNGPLDMRMNPAGELSAEDIVNEYKFEELKRIIGSYGEESWADAIARKIVEKRKEKRLETTGQLVEVIDAAIPEGVKARRKNHPATGTFQGLRIAVNDELNNLEGGLEKGFNCLSMNGVMVVISYHSLEDRKVKRFFNFKAKDCICPPELPVCRCDKESELDILTEGALRPAREEVEANPRARSARLRAGRKLVAN